MSTDRRLKLATGQPIIADEDDSFDVTGTFTDHDDNELSKDSITALTCTLIDKETATIINSRTSAQSIKDANGGTLTDDVSGVAQFEFKFSAADMIIVGTVATGEIEVHLWKVSWSWTDDDGVARSKNEVYEIQVRSFPTPVEPPA